MWLFTPCKAIRTRKTNNDNYYNYNNTSTANSLLKEIGLKISLNTGESRETSFLYQRISVLVQRFIAVLLHLANRWLHRLIIAPMIV